MKTYQIHLRVVRVVPVEVQADSFEEAMEKAIDGDCNYIDQEEYTSSLDLRQFTVPFENYKIID
jgi:hypothetical protein